MTYKIWGERSTIQGLSILVVRAIYIICELNAQQMQM